MIIFAMEWGVMAYNSINCLNEMIVTHIKEDTMRQDPYIDIDVPAMTSEQAVEKYILN